MQASSQVRCAGTKVSAATNRNGLQRRLGELEQAQPEAVHSPQHTSSCRNAHPGTLLLVPAAARLVGPLGHRHGRVSPAKVLTCKSRAPRSASGQRNVVQQPKATPKQQALVSRLTYGRHGGVHRAVVLSSLYDSIQTRGTGSRSAADDGLVWRDPTGNPASRFPVAHTQSLFGRLSLVLHA